MIAAMSTISLMDWLQSYASNFRAAQLELDLLSFMDVFFSVVDVLFFSFAYVCEKHLLLLINVKRLYIQIPGLVGT